MCIEHEYHYGGTYNVNVKEFFYITEIVHMNEKTDTSVSSQKEQLNESQYIVSCPELGLDPPIGSDRDSGRDILRL